MQRDRQGFTLMELLIAMALMVIITGFLIYMWINTVQTMRFAQSAVAAHTQGRRIMRLLTDTMQNTSGCYPVLAGDEGPAAAKLSAHFAGIDSYTVETIGGNLYARTRGFKWGVAHRDGGGGLQFDFETGLPTFSPSPVHAYASEFATGRWIGGREVFLGQTVVPLNPGIYDMDRIYRSIGTGRLNARDESNAVAKTGGAEPTWPVAYGETVQDGDVTWMCVPPYLHASPIHIPGVNVGRIAYGAVTGTGGIDTDAVETIAVDTSRRVSIFASNVGDFGMTLSSMVDPELVFASEAARDSHFASIPGAQRAGVQIRVVDLIADIDEFQLWEWDMGEEAGAWKQVFPGMPEGIDTGGVYTGFRGVRPQGRGYRPYAGSDTDESLHPLTPSWVRVDFEVTGDVRPGMDPAELPRFTFTHMLLLR